MAIETTFIIIAAILFIGFLGELIFERTNIPDVIWLLLIGIVMSLFFDVDASAFSQAAPLFTTFALIFLLFEAGVNIDIKKFFKSAPQGLALTVLSFFASFVIVFFLGLLIGLGMVLSLLLAAIVSGISSAVVLPVIRNMDVNQKVKLSMVIDSALSDVLCILATVTIVEVVTRNTFSAAQVTNSILSAFLIAITVGLVCGYVWSLILIKWLKARGTFHILTLACMMVVFSLTQILGANGAIAALVFGLVLGNSAKAADLLREKINLITKSGKEFYAEISFLIKTFFFVYLGLLIDFSQPLSFLWAFIILVGLYLARPFAVWVALDKKTPLSDVQLAEVLIPKGLAAAVLVQLPLQAKIPGAEKLVNIVLAVILLSIIASTILVFLVQKGTYKGIYPFLYDKYSTLKKGSTKLRKKDSAKERVNGRGKKQPE
ncbi:hypothetical protein D6774_03020 [Candidatus Woesearchaeota archaeon]|jgi:NhaP-type Na+/H+ or K+/H+ antiporter|nr:MAG: hypothetical protein D6774_03020 [Candidatus Woesearchaeota archaeon]